MAQCWIPAGARTLFRACNFFMFVHKFQWASSEFFSNFRFYTRKSESERKLAKKITHFIIQFCSKNLIHFTNLNSLDIENNMFPQHSQKLNMLLSVVKKKKHLHCTISWSTRTAFLKQMSIYFCISVNFISVNFCSTDVVRFYLVGVG